MLNITFDAKVRLHIPEAREPTIQSVYIFNMYRAASSVTEAVAETLSKASLHTNLNIVQILDSLGLSLVDHEDYSRHAVYMDAQTLSLDAIGGLGGYIYYGFREIPRPYADRFIFSGASVIVVRDPRDIAISQYSAIKKHVVDGASGRDIVRLRELMGGADISDFVLSHNTISFLKRITQCYEPLIMRGAKVLRYEEFFTPDGFDSNQLLRTIVESLHPYLQLQRPMEWALENLQRRIANSPDLKGHATGGQIRMHSRLPEETQKKLHSALERELLLFGYS